MKPNNRASSLLGGFAAHAEGIAASSLGFVERFIGLLQHLVQVLSGDKQVPADADRQGHLRFAGLDFHQGADALTDAFQRLQRHLLRNPGGDREMVEILALVLHHDEQLVLTAVTMALEAGVPTKTHILNLLYRLVDGKPISTPPVTAPQALKLVSEPMANVERYDDLRKEKRHAS